MLCAIGLDPPHKAGDVVGQSDSARSATESNVQLLTHLNQAIFQVVIALNFLNRRVIVVRQTN